jgi:branched-subunit amino acid ABC-type transport system permease component
MIELVLAANIPFDGVNIAQLTANGIITGSAYALVAVGFGMIIHVTGRFHIAFAAIYAWTAFLAAQLQLSFGVSFSTAMIVATVVGMAAALLIERFVYAPLVRRVGHRSLFAIFIASLGLSTAAEALINIVWQNPITLETDVEPVALGTVNLTNLTLTGVIVTWVLVLILVAVLRWTNLGRMIRAVRVNPDLAVDYGISTARIYLVVFAVGTALGGVGAVYRAAQTAPASDIGENLVLYAITAAFIAGAASSPVMIALLALLMGLVQSWSAFVISPTWASFLVFAILLVYVLLKAGRKVNWARLVGSRGRYDEVVTEMPAVADVPAAPAVDPEPAAGVAGRSRAAVRDRR